MFDRSAYDGFEKWFNSTDDNTLDIITSIVEAVLCEFGKYTDKFYQMGCKQLHVGKSIKCLIHFHKIIHV